jgi:hypothetical protein
LVGFATGRVTTPDPMMPANGTVEQAPVFIRPGQDRGQVKGGPGYVEVAWPVRPASHGGGDVKGG